VNRTLRTEIDLPNADEALLPGMYVDVTVVVEHPHTWTLPGSAVVTEEGQSFCYRVEDGKAGRTPLRIGLRGDIGQRGDGLVEVLKTGRRPASPGAEETWEDFTGKEEIVKSDAARLKDSQAVRLAVGDK
jgi:hypothetical protein